MAVQEKKGPKKIKQVGEAHCRGCNRVVSRDKDKHVKIGGNKYHPECAEAKPQMHQRWDEATNSWIRT